MGRRIDFGSNGQRDSPWLALSIEQLEEWANRDGALPLPFRIFCVAAARVNLIGHGEFKPGELAALLETTPGSLRDGIRRAKSQGLIESSMSFARCIVIPRQIVQQGRDGGWSCGWHGLGTKARKRTRPRRDYLPEGMPSLSGPVEMTHEEMTHAQPI